MHSNVIYRNFCIYIFIINYLFFWTANYHVIKNNYSIFLGIQSGDLFCALIVCDRKQRNSPRSKWVCPSGKVTSFSFLLFAD